MTNGRLPHGNFSLVYPFHMSTNDWSTCMAMSLYGMLYHLPNNRTMCNMAPYGVAMSTPYDLYGHATCHPCSGDEL
jgi:hypothetical protein